MTRSVSFVMWLLLLLATLVAAAWGIHHVRMAAPQSFAAVEIDAYEGGRICVYTPGHLFGPPTAVEAAEAREAFYDWGQICRYDPARGFGAWPTNAELEATKVALGPWGTMDRALAALWTLWGSIGLAGIGHGLLVGSISIFNPHFVSIGWWLLAPEMALAQAGWLGAFGLGLGTLAVDALGPRYIARRATIESMRRGVRPWLTPKRIGLAAGGWLATVGVLAAVYPNVAALLPKSNPLVVAQSGPRIGSPTVVSGNRRPGGGGEQVAVATVDAVTPQRAPFTPPAQPQAQQPQTPAQQQTAQLAMPNPFNPMASFASGSSGGTSGGGATGGGATAGVTEVAFLEPVSSAISTIATYFPPSNAQQPASTPTNSGTPATVTPTIPAETMPTTSPAGEAIALTPIVDSVNPLPTDEVTVMPAAPTETAIVDGPAVTPSQPAAETPVAETPSTGTPAAETPAAETPAATTPANPANPADPTKPVRPGVRPDQVPEPATLGLFGLGIAALSLRRKGRNKR